MRISEMKSAAFRPTRCYTTPSIQFLRRNVQHITPHCLPTTTTTTCYDTSTMTTKLSVFTAKFPLIGLEITDNIPLISNIAALHEAVVIADESAENVLLFDFLPEQPNNTAVLAALLSGNAVNAVARIKKLKKLQCYQHKNGVDVDTPLQHRRLVLVGQSTLEKNKELLKRAVQFQFEWSRYQLQLMKCDCRTHVQELVSHLQVYLSDVH